ncbi:GNAT family N-acetyltransferase [Acerihabitans arboris]|uniref:GNAT family N-acetyltransferase n=1 Tax=Acerihabitans arboris TaxID=2691583 RepID=A0A845SKL5_9GAMM|nr:GNAT family N-acetyltransferase [Acerihabitans arboris]NDL63922.1 GNAT family N-acetyltransferase [Acerihabitans arboris]
MSIPLSITDASEADMAAIQAIYAWHVLHGIASFETEPPAVADMIARRAAVLDKGLPWLAAKFGDRVVGYCYLGLYRPRHAYRFTVEDSVYIHPEMGGQGIGHALLVEAIARAQRGGWRQMLAVIGDSDNIGSIRLHEKLGFRLIGTLAAVGFKHGRWVDTLLMQRSLGEGQNTLPGPPA